MKFTVYNTSFSLATFLISFFFHTSIGKLVFSCISNDSTLRDHQTDVHGHLLLLFRNDILLRGLLLLHYWFGLRSGRPSDLERRLGFKLGFGVFLRLLAL